MRNLTNIAIFLLMALGAVFNSAADDKGPSLSSLIGNNQVLVIGESYGQFESPRFVTQAVSDYINKGNCLKVGLEIPSNQQGLLNNAMAGQGSISEIAIDNVVDHDDYREMLVNFSEQIIAGKCLFVYAIAAPDSTLVSKDAWMEKQVLAIVGDQPVLLLVENKRAVKNYREGDEESGKLLTQRLQSKGIKVVSVLQHWKPGQCEYKMVEMIETTDAQSTMFVKEAMGELRAEAPAKISMVADGVLVWSCERVVVKEEVSKQNGRVAGETLSVDIEEFEVVERDAQVLKKINWGIKHEYPIVGMNRAEAREALGEPDEVEKAGQVEQWSYQCSDDDGFDYICFILVFSEKILVKYSDL